MPAPGRGKRKKETTVKRTRRIFFLYSIAILALAAADAKAQFRGGVRGEGRGGPDNGSKESRPPTQENRVDQLEQLLEELREDLKLTPEQQSAWQTYATKIRAMASDIARERNRGRANAQSDPVQRIDHSVDVARDRLTALEDIASAAKTLYASLSPDQKSAANPRLATIIPMSPDGVLSSPPERTGRQRISK
jgi:hypothetical protein